MKLTTVRSLLSGMARVMNLISPSLDLHHQRTAYAAYLLCQEMGLDRTDANLALFAAVFHDVGFIVLGEIPDITLLEKSEQFRRIYSKVGQKMLEDLPGFSGIARVIGRCQLSFSELDANHPIDRIAGILHVADFAATALDGRRPILNQRPALFEIAGKCAGSEFYPEAVRALERLGERESFWLDLIHDPVRVMDLTGEISSLTLFDTLHLTRSVSRLIDYRSAFTAMHSAGVAGSAVALARLCGMNEEDCLRMEIAGNLHDLGKLAVPGAILEKPGKLTEEEFNVIREHPYYTRLLLSKIEGFAQIADWAALHHEKLNGKGYPYHLSADSLDEGCRIMAVADIFSAITEERPYRKGMDKESALSVLSRAAGAGEIDADLTALLADHYSEVNELREASSRLSGQRYFAILREKRETEEKKTDR